MDAFDMMVDQLGDIILLLKLIATLQVVQLIVIALFLVGGKNENDLSE